jgi:adenylate cyclase
MTSPDRAPDVQPIVDWLIGGASAAVGADGLVDELCCRMRTAGVPLARAALFVRPLHPNVAARAFYWRQGDRAVEVSDQGHEFIGTDEQLASPVRAVSAARSALRRRLCDDATPLDFPVLHELRAGGMTDYLMMPLEFLDGEVHTFSVATRQAGGFTDAEVAAIALVHPALTRIVEIRAAYLRAGNILDAYLGRHAGGKVLQGRIRRGDTETIDAVIWFCDLRDSTSLAETLGPQGFLALLNAYFEAMLDPVMERGGQVLSFIGDAALAIFPIGDDAVGAASRAVDAAREAMARAGALDAIRGPSGGVPLRFGIGLHAGELLYGNVGTPTRITFTVVGTAANEAARIEAMCKALGESLVVSARVTRLVPASWRSLGAHALRGVGQPMELFTLA